MHALQADSPHDKAVVKRLKEEWKGLEKDELEAYINLMSLIIPKCNDGSAQLGKHKKHKSGCFSLLPVS